MKKKLTLTAAMMMVTGIGSAALDRFVANYVDRSYSHGWPREYSGLLWEQEAYKYMHDYAAKYIVTSVGGTEYINSASLQYLYSEPTGVPGSNELTHYYSHSVYGGPFSPPTATEELDSNGLDPRACNWEGWTPGVTDGGYAFGGSVHFYGPRDYILNFIDNEFKANGEPYNLHGIVGACNVKGDSFLILAAPIVHVTKLHNSGK